MLRGRRKESAALDRLLDAVRRGESGVLVLHGEAGIGKSALLEYVRRQASDCRVERAVGMESEMELAFAGLHQLCGAMMNRLEELPAPQRDALATAFGLIAGPAPDPFLVGLAVLSLLSEVADEQPLVCLVDDAQWLDQASADTLAFVARRLLAESVAMVFATRASSGELPLTGLPEMEVRGLGQSDARALLESALHVRLDEDVRERIVAETRGNPLALLELPHGLTPADLAGGFSLGEAPALSGRIEESFRRRLNELPEQTRLLLLVAAADPSGEPALVWRAADRIGLGTDSAEPAMSAGLIELGAHIRFRHPLVRSAVYGAAQPDARRRVHAALADATDPATDPDRRAWHRARAATGPDEELAGELERSAGRAQARGGLAAAASFFEQAAKLTPDAARRGERTLATAQAKLQAGSPEPALSLVADAAARPLDDLGRARVDLLRGQIAYATRHGSEAPLLLLQAARHLEPLNTALARETYLNALAAAQFAGEPARGAGVLEIAEAILAAPPAADPPSPADLLLDGLATYIAEGCAAGVSPMQRAIGAFCREHISSEDALRWLPFASRIPGDALWDYKSWDVLVSRHIRLAREAGALAALPLALTVRAAMHCFGGDLATAASVSDEAKAVQEAARVELSPYAPLAVAAWRGQEAETASLIEATLEDAMDRGEGLGVTLTQWTAAVLYNGLGRYEEALAAAGQASKPPQAMGCANWALVEMIEAAARSGEHQAAAEGVELLATTTEPSGTDWALGIEARSRALISDGQDAERLHHKAIERLGRAGVRAELARAHLVYGEWLRREQRRVEAREQLRAAHGMFGAMGAEAFERRAARELLATGERARKRTVETREDLTSQEAQIARFARDGLTNPEIAGRLFISPRTVEYHLSKVFAKLDISSRHELARALPTESRAAQTA